MYAQCPACLTTFKVAPAQLARRDGVVRCGICSAIFHAEQHLLQLPPKTSPQTDAQPGKETASSRRNKNRRDEKNRRSSVRRRGKIKSMAVPFTEDSDIPTVTELSGLAKPRHRWHAVIWGLGDVLLLTLLAGQFMYFYRNELAVYPSWRPTVREFCRYASCEIRPRRDIALMELLQTTIAPHPKYENALRIRTTLVNRAAFPQAYPGMEVSLTDNAGTVLARRTFSPSQYLEIPAAGVLTPNLVVTTLLDVTNPHGKAVGYEIRLVAP